MDRRTSYVVSQLPSLDTSSYKTSQIGSICRFCKDKVHFLGPQRRKASLATMFKHLSESCTGVSDNERRVLVKAFTAIDGQCLQNAQRRQAYDKTWHSVNASSHTSASRQEVTRSSGSSSHKNLYLGEYEFPEDKSATKPSREPSTDVSDSESNALDISEEETKRGWKRFRHIIKPTQLDGVPVKSPHPTYRWVLRVLRA